LTPFKAYSFLVFCYFYQGKNNFALAFDVANIKFETKSNLKDILKNKLYVFCKKR